MSILDPFNESKGINIDAAWVEEMNQQAAIVLGRDARATDAAEAADKAEAEADEADAADKADTGEAPISGKPTDINERIAHYQREWETCEASETPMKAYV